MGLNKKKCCNCLIISTLEGCPVGLEPTTFRTTSTFTDCWATHLYIVVSEGWKKRVCGYFAAIHHKNSKTLDRTFFTNSLFFIVFIM